jgi:hypothetical protein
LPHPANTIFHLLNQAVMRFLTFIALLTVGASLFWSCKRCPPDTNLGLITLSPESRLYLPYDGTEKLIFKDNAGDEIILSVSDFQDTTRESCFPTCWGYAREMACLNMLQEFKLIKFQHDSVGFIIDVFASPTGAPIISDTSLFELFTVRYNSVGAATSLLLETTHKRDNNFLTTADSLSFSNSMALPSIHFIDSTYYDVKTNGTDIWYNLTYGLVAFNFNNRLYELKTIE